MKRKVAKFNMGKIPVHLGPHKHGAEDIPLGGDLASVLGLAAGSTVDDALLLCYLTGKGGCILRATVLLPNGAPASNMSFTLTDTQSRTITTDANGKFSTFVTNAYVSITSRSCIDLMSSVGASTPIGTIAEVVFRFPNTGVRRRQFTSSTNGLTFSPAVASVDVFCVGGGGGGGNAGGGGGGYTKTALNLPIRATLENLVIGPGGNGGTNGNIAVDGSPTSFYGVVAPGGKAQLSSGRRAGDGGSGGGGTGNTPGGGGSDGANGTNAVDSGLNAGGTGQGTSTREFGETSGALYAGGGSGGGTVSYQGVAVPGGTGGGGSGGIINNVPTAANGHPGTAGTGGGGGGGASASKTLGGAGGSGIVVVRWKYK